MKRPHLLACAVLVATPLWAEDLRPAPDYYIDALFSLTMAEALATSCSGVGMDLLAAGAASTGLTEQLVADGFDAEQPFRQMIDPAPALRDLQAMFLDKHPVLSAPDEAAVCAVARAEIAEATVIGRLLIDGADLGGLEAAPDAPSEAPPAQD